MYWGKRCYRKVFLDSFQILILMIYHYSVCQKHSFKYVYLYLLSVT